MSKKSWDDSHKYSVELTAREIRVISVCLGLGKTTLESLPYDWSKVNKGALEKLYKDFYNYSERYFCFGLYPDVIGRRAKRVEPPIDKP